MKLLEDSRSTGRFGTRRDRIAHRREPRREHGRGALLFLRAAEAPALAVGDPTEAQVKVVREAEEYLDDVKGRIQAGTREPTITTSVWYGSPTEAIAEAARFNRANMVVMTTHGRSGLGGHPARERCGIRDPQHGHADPRAPSRRRAAAGVARRQPPGLHRLRLGLDVGGQGPVVISADAGPEATSCTRRRTTAPPPTMPSAST